MSPCGVRSISQHAVLYIRLRSPYRHQDVVLCLPDHLPLLSPQGLFVIIAYITLKHETTRIWPSLGLDPQRDHLALEIQHLGIQNASWAQHDASQTQREPQSKPIIVCIGYVRVGFALAMYISCCQFRSRWVAISRLRAKN